MTDEHREYAKGGIIGPERTCWASVEGGCEYIIPMALDRERGRLILAQLNQWYGIPPK